MLKINNIRKQFGQKIILNNIYLKVKAGEVAVLLGGSGVGKSTVLRVLNNLETLDAGNCTLDDKPFDLTTVHKTHSVGMVFQNFNLFVHLTVIENITLPLTKILNLSEQKAHERATQLLQKYGLADKANAKIQSLSGGQKQRLAIARTLALKPKILCMDEPTSALDPLLTTHIAQTINELAQEGYIVIIATHDTELLKKIDCTIYLMESGTIIESATSQKLQRNHTQYPKLHSFITGQ